MMCFDVGLDYAYQISGTEGGNHKEALYTSYTAHSGSTKVHQDLRHSFWWNNMKSDVVDFLANCLICQQVKDEDQRPLGLLEPLRIAEWKWEHVTTILSAVYPEHPRVMMQYGLW